tara:strand:+ start:695 stop:1123 length:429 start_codon:yes stop_codon:yes gene_type:complete
MYLTNFFSEGKTHKIKNAQKIRKVIKTICLDHKIKLGFMNCIFCSDEHLLKINIKYLKHDYYTDIITFDFSEDKDKLEGDLYISVDRITENTKLYKTTKELEIVRLIAHGCLHLIGYSDKTEKEKKRMRSLENKYISLYKKS